MADIIISLVVEVAKCLAPSVGRQINYFRKCKTNFENLKTEVEKLKYKSMSIQHEVDAVKRNGEEIEENVQKWLEKAKDIEENFQKWKLERASMIIHDDEAAGKIGEDEETATGAAAKKRCFKGLCPDWKTRYLLSKEAETLQQAVFQHLEAGKFDKISYVTIPKDPRLSNKDFEAFESRKSTLMNVICSLSDPNVNIVGIYGMGGIGKTTLAKEVAKQTKTDKVFDSVILVEVTEKPDIMKIQNEIAEKLGLLLSKEESESTRAAKLYRRLENEKKVLLILDNIWAHLDLQAIGIPHRGEHKECKVLLTARKVDVLEKMDSQPNFPVDLLDDEEAWHLFTQMIGDIEGSELKSVAREVANQCACLPIVIVTLARALRNKELFVWEDALQQMRMFSSENIQGIHSSIELSYTYLESEVLKKTILLIRYANIKSIDELLMYGMGLGLFEGINTMERRRVRACRLIQQLKDSCLLFDSNTTGEDFSMHDIVRDVAISIAFRDQHVFTNELFDELEWPDMDSLKAYPSIFLKDVKTYELPQVLECQQLKLLFISGENSLTMDDEFFTRMTELKVLVLANVNLESLPSSFCFLANLQVLSLYDCYLNDIAITGSLKKLEILSIKRSRITQLPVEIGHLTRLKLLELSGDGWICSVIPPNVISSLSHLEELYIGGFTNWEVEGLNKDRQNASPNELKHLSNLTCLEIEIQDAKALPRDLLFFKKLERFKIAIGRSRNFEWDRDWIWDFERPNSCRKFTLSLSNTNICLNDGHIMQLKGIEDLFLVGSQDMKSILYGLDRDGFPQLKFLQVRDNDNLLCIVDSIDNVSPNAFPLLESLLIKNLINLEKICRGQLTTKSFSQLTQIKVKECDKLKHIFSFSIARRLQLLQSIDVVECQNMEEIFAMKTEDESISNTSEVIDNIELFQLRSLTVGALPQLRSFCSESKTPSISQQRQDGIILEEDINVSNTLFTKKVVLPKVEFLELYGVNVERIWQNQDVAISASIQNLTRLILHGCHNLRYLFSSSIASSFIQLLHLEISECQAIEEIIISDKRKDVVFPQLLFLKMEGLQNLIKFFSGDSIEFPSLKELNIAECPELKEFIVKNISMDLTEIPLPFFNEKVALPNLEILIVASCSNLRCIFSSSFASSFVRLQRLDITECSALEEMIAIDDDKCKGEVKNVAFPISNTNRHLKIRVEHCDKLKTLFSLNVYRKFLRLESLSVHRCGSLEVIFDLEGPDFGDKHRAVVTQLSKLEIYGLPKLRQVWNKDPKKFLSFHELKKVTIVGCESLKNVFPVSVACNLSQLESLDISRCGVEEIVFVSEEGAETNLRFVFPRVASLTLDDLPKFTMFFPGIYTTEWPGLTSMNVSGWEMVNLSFQGSNKEGHPQFLVENVFPNLVELTVETKGRTAVNWFSPIWQFPDLFCNLKYLYIKFDASTVVSSLDFFQRFDNLKMLKILGKPGYFGYGFQLDTMLGTKVENGMSAAVINLNVFSDLKQILKEESNMDHLVHLKVQDCDHLVHLVPSSTSFRNLTTLEVFGCRGLTSIVTYSTAMSLGKLREMTIEGCYMIIELVAADKGDEAKDYEIVFRELKELCLYGLTSLTSFCSANYTLKFPSLEELTLETCCEMRSFSGGKLSTPKLQKVKERRMDKEFWKGDLNTTIKELYE